MPKTLNASGKDPETELIKTIFQKNDVVVDFGAGKGRFFEELVLASNPGENLLLSNGKNCLSKRFLMITDF